MQRKRQGLDEPMTENLQTSPQAGGDSPASIR